MELDPGDGRPAYSLKLQVQKSSALEDFIYGISIVMHTYSGEGDVFTTVLRKFQTYVCIHTCIHACTYIMCFS